MFVSFGHVRLYTSPWLKEVRCVLNNCGLSDVWLQREVANPVWLRKTIEQRLRDQWITRWYSNISLKSVCTTYVIFKSCYGMEGYITKLRTKSRIVLTKLRANNNKLPVITGRYQNISREGRLRNKWGSGIVGDEYHVVLECNNQVIRQ